MNQIARDITFLFQERAGAVINQLNKGDRKINDGVIKDILDMVKAIVKRSSMEERDSIEAAERIALAMNGSADLSIIVTIVTDITFYYYDISSNSRGIQSGHIALALAAETDNKNLARRAHAAMAAHFIAIYDFELACYHLELALVLARNLQNDVYECSALSNIVILLFAMGLYGDAIKVSLKALSYGTACPALSGIQFHNALTVLQCAQLGRIKIDAKPFYLLACRTLRSLNYQVGEVIRAHFEQQRALYLIERGRHDRARSFIVSAIKKSKSLSNLKIKALLFTAKALCEFASREPHRVVLARRLLRRLVRDTTELPIHHEDVLRALIKVYSGVSSKDGKDLGLSYTHTLYEYIVDMKQVEFHRLVCIEARRSIELQNSADQPAGTIERWLEVGCHSKGDLDTSVNDADLTAHDQLTVICNDLAKLQSAGVEQEFRTGAFDIAENWAVASELSLEGTGHHCFRVGKLACAMAVALGYRKEECVQIELAVRLHDIGKMAIGEMALRKFARLSEDESVSIRDHTVAGERFLMSSSDPTLRRASAIARSHHEWWNGCGYPDALRGKQIPVEARICAVADTYDKLTSLGPYHSAWSHQAAVRQILTMGGVQLDPNLMDPFLIAVDKYAGEQEHVTETVNRSMVRNQLARAKTKLFKTLELVE